MTFIVPARATCRGRCRPRSPASKTHGDCRFGSFFWLLLSWKSAFLQRLIGPYGLMSLQDGPGQENQGPDKYPADQKSCQVFTVAAEKAFPSLFMSPVRQVEKQEILAGPSPA